MHIGGTGRGQNQMLSGAILKDWSERSRSSIQIQGQIQAAGGAIDGETLTAVQFPALPGSSGGLPVQMVLRSPEDFKTLYDTAEKIKAAAYASGLFVYVQNDLAFDSQQAHVAIDSAKAREMGVTMQAIAETLAVLVGENYVNRFNFHDRSYDVIPQVRQDDRMTPEDLGRFYVKTVTGALVPLATVARVETRPQANQLTQFGQMNSATLVMLPRPGISMGEAVAFLQSQPLPASTSVDWLSDSRQFVQEGNRLWVSFGFALVVIFLVLAAQFESLRDPLVILVTVPLAVCGALVPLWLGYATLNIYTQIGLVTLIGLISKHGILMVTFANHIQEHENLSRIEAIEKAATVRMRPVLMTTAAMVAGLVPLLFAGGAGSASRYSIGVVVVMGMLIGTLFTLFVLPTIYSFIAKDHRAAAQARAPANWRRRRAMRIESSQRPTGRARALAAPLLLALALGGCASGPDYRAPATPSAPPVRSSASPSAPTLAPSCHRTGGGCTTTPRSTACCRKRWRPIPTCARRWPIWTRRARSTARPVGLLPSTQLSGGTRYGRNNAAGGGDGPAPRQWSYSGGLEVAYEVDLFGRVRRDIEAARYDADAVAAAYDAARVLVVADTARAYLNACAYGESEQVARASIALAQRNLDLISEQERAGSASRLDAERAGVALARTEAALAPIEARRSAALFELAALLGRTPAQVPQAARACASPPEPGGAIPVGDGAALLRRRPDLRQAERRLAADTARIGVAVADLYPRVTLGASGSYLRNDTLTGDRAWSFALGPLVSWSFPNIAAARSRIEQAEAQSAASLARFDGAVLNALKETEQALSAYDAAIRQRDALVQARTRADNAFRLAEQRYRAGSISYLDVLVAQESLVTAMSQEAALKQQVAPRGSTCSRSWAAAGSRTS